MLDKLVERKIKTGMLLDFYGGFLTEKQRLFLDLHHNQDFSLVEIAEQQGISRQGVHDAIRRGEATLLEMDRRLGLAGKFDKISAGLELMRDELEKWKPSRELDQDLRKRLCAAIDDMKTHWDE